MVDAQSQLENLYNNVSTKKCKVSFHSGNSIFYCLTKGCLSAHICSECLIEDFDHFNSHFKTFLPIDEKKKFFKFLNLQNIYAFEKNEIKIELKNIKNRIKSQIQDFYNQFESEMKEIIHEHKNELVNSDNQLNTIFENTNNGILRVNEFIGHFNNDIKLALEKNISLSDLIETYEVDIKEIDNKINELKTFENKNENETKNENLISSLKLNFKSKLLDFLNEYIGNIFGIQVEKKRDSKKVTFRKENEIIPIPLIKSSSTGGLNGLISETQIRLGTDFTFESNFNNNSNSKREEEIVETLEKMNQNNNELNNSLKLRLEALSRKIKK